MLAILLLLLLVLPVVELAVIVRVAAVVGIGPTLVLLIGISVAGAWLLKQQGTSTWRRLRAALARGDMPAQEVIDGALILFGGALLLTPGFVTDALGLVLLIPPSRAVVKRAGVKAFGFWAGRRWGPAVTFGRRVYSTRATSTRRHDRPDEHQEAANAARLGSAEPPPSEPRPDGAAGSRDRE